MNMIDEMMTLLELEQVGEDNKKACYVKSFVEKDDEAKAPTRLITGHKDLLSSRAGRVRGGLLSQVFETSTSPSRK